MIAGGMRRPWVLALLVLGGCLLSGAEEARAAPDLETLAGQIAKSIDTGLRNPKYQTIAFSRIKQAGSDLDVNTLIDYTNVKLVQGQRLRVVDRSKLQLILQEQQIQTSDFVSAQKYQELGKLTGVDLFIYGTLYRDALVLKAIDVQNSALAWADSFPLTDPAPESQALGALGQEAVDSMQQVMPRLQQANVRLVSFWGVDTAGLFPPEEVMDLLSVAIIRGGAFKVVDRENIKLIVAEQQLNQSVFIDEKSAKQLGELYGVDAFLYGGISRRADGTIVASLKMMSILNGVIEWADLLRVDEGATAVAGGRPAGPPAPPGMVLIPGGPFLMGSNSDFRESMPLHQVTLGPFFIDATEVSNRDYLRFVSGRHYRLPVGWPGQTPAPGTEDFPVVGVNWEDAQQYCRFAGKRLPLEAEWEKAARGASGQVYPWSGAVFSPGFTVTRESGRKHPEPVQSAGKDVSPYGVKDMAGNVREWVEDQFMPYQGAGLDNPRFGRERVVRGGSWATSQQSALTYFRGSSRPDLAWQDVGFRCARTVGG